ncbi:formate dehydrogenase subunit gamma [Desulfonatronovibrio hydrogenovorans]|uniref:formate dehydrogenase subunit gamma n=1 Tax=Desulfonatronovibrio hydrogenovorans TaxID=53245 RepID=UPI00048BEA37|nr:cytochrome b/b6 domain-containing protein [Desulfonatronovibrio hydrogenovorans]
MNTRMIHRHDRAAIFIHWFNALCWIFLTLTGLGLIKNDQINPVGAWWPSLMRTIFGSGETLLTFHIYTGLIWAAVFLIYIIIRRKQTTDFLKEIFSINPTWDTAWMIKKNIQLTLGKGALKKMGMTTDIPPQGFYNAGQKLFAQLTVIAGLVLVITGVIMYISTIILNNPTPVAWSRTIHFLMAGLAFAGLLVHIYMAAVSREERPAFKSMFSGVVPEDYAKHHHELWYNELKNR